MLVRCNPSKSRLNPEDGVRKRGLNNGSGKLARAALARLFQSILWRLRRSFRAYFTLCLQPEVHLRTVSLAALLPKLVGALSNFVFQSVHDFLLQFYAFFTLGSRPQTRNFARPSTNDLAAFELPKAMQPSSRSSAAMPDFSNSGRAEST